MSTAEILFSSLSNIYVCHFILNILNKESLDIRRYFKRMIVTIKLNSSQKPILNMQDKQTLPVLDSEKPMIGKQQDMTLKASDF